MKDYLSGKTSRLKVQLSDKLINNSLIKLGVKIMFENYFYIKKLKKEVKAGNKEAYFDLGMEYINGKKVRQNSQKGLSLINEAAELGCARAIRYQKKANILGIVDDATEIASKVIDSAKTILGKKK